MDKVFDWDGGITSYTYDAAGRLATTTLPNGVQTTNDYDAANRLTGLSHVDMSSGALQAEYLYELDGLGNRQVTTETLRLPDSGGGGLQTTFITYDYDPLYRLTGAFHTGGITATYRYIYDAVGNMPVYTETLGTEISNVQRTFNDANQLLVSTDTVLGTTSFYYDDNGNLVEIIPPGASGQNQEGTLRYGYDQRNLLITNTLYISGTGWVEQAAFVYDGAGNRVQQVNTTGSEPITTTYINDNTGLSQVLVASTGITTTHYLMGLNLTIQDDGVETRIMLADGLGSARTELVGSAIQTVSTYEPYGKLLAQTGASGTVYGYTGEQYDSATSLVYLRARYYNPNLKVFMSRDPFSGFNRSPASQHGYSYAHNNPVNVTDPTGEIAIPYEYYPTAAMLAAYLAGITLPAWAPIAGGVVLGVGFYDLVIAPALHRPGFTSMVWDLLKALANYAGEVCTVPNVTPGIRQPTIEELIDELNWDKRVPVPLPQPQPEEKSTPPPPPPIDRPKNSSRTAYLIGAGGAPGEAQNVMDEVSSKYDKVIINDIDTNLLHAAERHFRLRNPTASHVIFIDGNGALLPRLENGDVFIVAPNSSLHYEIPNIANNVIGQDTILYVATDFNFIGLPEMRPRGTSPTDVYSPNIDRNKFSFTDPVTFYYSISVGPRNVRLDSFHFKSNNNLLGTITRK